MLRISAGKKSVGNCEIVFVTEEQSSGIPCFEGKKNEITPRHEGEKTTIYCGTGNKNAGCRPEILRNQAAAAVRQAMKLKLTEISIFDPAEAPAGEQAVDPPEADAVIAALEGAALSTYVFSKHLSEKPPEVKTIHLVSHRINAKKIAHIKSVCEGVFLARNLVNDNAHTVTPEKLAAEAGKLAASSSGITCTVLDEKQIDKKGIGLLKAVGQGSLYPPRLIILQYLGAEKNKKSSAVIGKGVTFDTGGLNMKPTSHIETMRTDMAGAAAVLGLMKSLSLLKPEINVTGIIPAVQSAVGPKAFFPGDVYTSYSGKTVEIKNTDAEGRLILADALTYCQKHCAPSEIIDLATLTGAIIVSLGDLFGGLFSNNDNIAEKLLAAGNVSGEKLWRMPLGEEHLDSVKGDISDIINTSKFPPRHAGSSTAAAFIRTFLENDIPWAHLDIAGTAYNDREPRGICPKFATGFGVRLLLEYFRVIPRTGK